MRFYFDVTTRRLVIGPGNNLPLTSQIAFTRGDQPTITVQFLDNGVVTDNGAESVFFCLKEVGENDGDPLVLGTSFVKSGTGETTEWSGVVNFNTPELNEALGYDPETPSAEDLVSLVVSGEFGFVVDGRQTTSRLLSVLIENDIYRGDENEPESALTPYPTAPVANSVLGGNADGDGWQFTLATETPTAGAIPVAGEDGRIALEWLPEDLGAIGDSAYDVAVANGFEGTESEWLASLQGEDGTNGADGEDGASAYEIAVAEGFVGDVTAWLASLQGEDGVIGSDGDSAYEIAVANGFVGTESEWLESLQGEPGDPGGPAGPDGDSAYEIAVEEGFVGDVTAWLASLVGADGADGSDGADGDSAYEVAVANGFVGSESEWLESLVGPEGPAGGAPTDATYIVQTPSGGLSAEQALSDLATGLLKNTTATGVLSIAVAGTDYLAVPGGSAEGDILLRDATGWTRLPKGTEGHVLTAGATTVGYAEPTGGGGIGTLTLARFGALDNQPPASNYATFDTRNSIAVLDFDASTAESAVFVGIVPEGADFTAGIAVRIHWTATSATSGDVIWTTAFERSNTDLDSDSFATGVDSAAATANGTTGIATVTTINHSGSEIDGLTAGDLFRVKLTRKAADGSDTMTGDAEVIAVEIRQR